MHAVWNPWHGCKKYSEGCENCYMYYLDKQRGQDGSKIYKTKSGFNLPIQRDIHGRYKLKTGELIRIGLTSDFFLEEADEWRDEIWDIIRERRDLRFVIITKRINRVESVLPDDWGDGWNNVNLTVTSENQKRADERLPILMSLPFKHKSIMVAPFIEEVQIEKYLDSNQIDDVSCGGENYEGCRPCRYEWVESLRNQCIRTNTNFVFYETGTIFIKDNKRYIIKDKKTQSQQAAKSGLSYIDKPIKWNLTDSWGMEIPESEWEKPHFTSNCEGCGNRPLCSGCNNCGRCRANS